LKQDGILHRMHDIVSLLELVIYIYNANVADASVVNIQIER